MESAETRPGENGPGRTGPTRAPTRVPRGPVGVGLAIWWDGAAAGGTNMAVDELLAAEAARLGRPLMRFYGWRCPTVSLGGFQSIAEARGLEPLAGATLVRRPSGGGAIVHGTDLTYALAVPREHPLAVSALPLYEVVHRALADVLAAHGLTARLHPGAGGAGAFFCFSRRAVGDVVATPPGRPAAADDPKVLGSAQRRLPAAVLQHGSLLLTANTSVGPGGRHPGLGDLLPGLAEAGRDIAGDWVTRIATALAMPVEWQATAFADGRAADILSRTAKFESHEWLERR